MKTAEERLDSTQGKPSVGETLSLGRASGAHWSILGRGCSVGLGRVNSSLPTDTGREGPSFPWWLHFKGMSPSARKRHFGVVQLARGWEIYISTGQRKNLQVNAPREVWGFIDGKKTVQQPSWGGGGTLRPSLLPPFRRTEERKWQHHRRHGQLWVSWRQQIFRGPEIIYLIYPSV